MIWNSHQVFFWW